jgi:hypothetical protein
MNLADWLQGDHEPSERLKAVETLCRAVSDSSKTLDLDPAHIQMSGDECRPSEGKAVPSGRYRAPEMAQGGPPVPQSQVFTVGVLCFEILSGRSFEARGGPLLRDLRPDLPRDLSDAVQACLEMDAEWRPKDLSYLLGLVDALAANGAPAVKGGGGRGGRAASASPMPTNRARGKGPAPRSGPLLVFALVALAVSVAIAVYRLRQPIEPPALPPPSAAPLPSPVAREATPAAPPVPSTVASRPSTTLTPPSVAASPVRGSALPSPSPLRTAAAGTPPVPAANRVPSPAVTAAPVVAPVTAAPTPGPAASAPASTGTARPAEPAGPAAVTNVSPPLLHRGANVLVDVHGVGLRSEHQVRITRGREAARGIEVMRQRYVGPTLLQVLLKVDASAPTGAYTLSLVDGAGTATNARPFEVAK